MVSIGWLVNTFILRTHSPLKSSFKASHVRDPMHFTICGNLHCAAGCFNVILFSIRTCKEGLKKLNDDIQALAPISYAHVHHLPFLHLQAGEPHEHQCCFRISSTRPSPTTQEDSEGAEFGILSLTNTCAQLRTIFPNRHPVPYSPRCLHVFSSTSSKVRNSKVI